mgnify:FL=1
MRKCDCKENRSKPLKITALALDIIVLSYFSLYVYWVFGVPDIDAHPLTQLFVAINPMTAGAYCIGAAMLIHLAAYKNIIGRCVICLPYVLSTIASAVSLMGMTGWKDLMMLIPHIFIIAAAVTIIVKQQRSTKINCNIP